jgi:UDP-N-acetylglucosamine/UDP-N-acetylgalactosamine diphosphorylase
MINSSSPLAATLAALAHIGQEHVLSFFESLSPAERVQLLDQVQALPLAELPKLIKDYVTGYATPPITGEITPPRTYMLKDPFWDRAAFKSTGEAMIASGQIAAFTVAGGQGTRLGFDGPKGCYAAGAVTNKPLFQFLAESILASQRRYAKLTTPGAKGPELIIPWYIMTSPLNHDATVAFFQQNQYFGLEPGAVRFFQQGVMPSFDKVSGKMLLESKASLALSPDGHGGSIRALATSGALADMEARGIKHLSYTQIDNPLVRVIDPVFIGLHATAKDSSGQMSSKMVPKASPDEKVGLLCSVGATSSTPGKTTVVEYSDLPQALATARNPDGSLKYAAGNIAVHLISVAFLKQLATGALQLPYHRAEKKVPHIDLATGQRIEPTTPNAIKLELFVFDALSLADASIVVETDRIEEFAPIKNATGNDSPESCRAIQSQRALRWLEQAGLGHAVPKTDKGLPACTIELSPLSALEPADLRGRQLPPLHAGSVLSL